MSQPSKGPSLFHSQEQSGLSIQPHLSYSNLILTNPNDPSSLSLSSSFSYSHSSVRSFNFLKEKDFYLSKYYYKVTSRGKVGPMNKLWDFMSHFTFSQASIRTFQRKNFLCLLILFIIAVIGARFVLLECQGESVSFASYDLLSFDSNYSPPSNEISKEEKQFYNNLVVIISLDGFRYEYLQRNLTPTLNQIASNGIKSKMRSVFPTYTFPNHLSIVTGVYPDVHGIVNNYFYDPLLNESYSYSRNTSHEPKWYFRDPIWNAVEKNGKKSAVVAWPGSETPINGIEPTYLVPYNRSLQDRDVVKQIVSWIDLPLSERPLLISTYFSLIDSIGHHFGPDSPQMTKALIKIDKEISYLISNLKKRNIYDEINLFIVSDHGMTNTTPETDYIYIDHILTMEQVFSFDPGSVAFIRPKNKSDTIHMYNLLKIASRAKGTFDVFLKEELPMDYHYGLNPRVAEIIIISKSGYVVTHSQFKWSPKGLHGYPYPNEDMMAIFIAHSPHLRKIDSNLKEESLFPFLNLDLYPLWTKLLNITGMKGNGTSYLVDTFF